jgi:hypothetical protein
MTLPFPLPDWMPSWVPVAILVPLLLYALAFLFMPFSVIGVKSRLEGIEARLDEIQGELRNLVLRLPEPLRGGYDDSPMTYVEPRATRRLDQRSDRPPIPPAPYRPEEAEPEMLSRRERLGAPDYDPRGRAEPRLDRPR